MIHEKQFSLDDTLDELFGTEPWFPRIANASAITVRHLMTHTSGLVRYEFNPTFTQDLTANPDKVWTGVDRLSYLFDAKPPFAPGQGWEYSDTNYIVLGMIIEHVSKNTFYDELRKRVLGPFGLKDTVPADTRTVPGLVQGYAGANNPFGGSDEMIKDGKFAVNPQFEWTGGGLAVTALDLAKWGKILYEGKAFDASMMAPFLDGVPARLGPETKYGLGVIIRPTALGVTYGHSGFMPGYQTELMYFPDLKASIAVQVNSSAPRSTGKSLRAFVTDFAEIVKAAGLPGARPGHVSTRIFADQAHGQAPLADAYTQIAAKLGAEIVASREPITAEALEGYRLLVLRVPRQAFAEAERDAITGFVKQGGSLLLAFDEERRAPLATTRVNDLIAPFGLKLTNDTEYLHNNGAIAKKGVINAADRELPFSGGRAVEGGTPFAWQLDTAGQPAQVFAAFATAGTGGRVVVLGDAMATLFLGTSEGVRLSGVPRDPTRTTYWGKDSGVFMEELFAWLLGRSLR
jgi:D-alanyl-D-alanine carboxypeptidase